MCIKGYPLTEWVTRAAITSATLRTRLRRDACHRKHTPKAHGIRIPTREVRTQSPQQVTSLTVCVLHHDVVSHL
ncbi:unnamed protein product, partial [Closterium sp. Naga37s-1]